MTKQQRIETMGVALKYLGWQGGTIWQIEKELQKCTGIIGNDDVFVCVRDVLVLLGVMKND